MLAPPNPHPAATAEAAKPAAAPAAEARQTLPPPVILGAMLRSAKNASDLVFSPGRLPQVEQGGLLVPVRIHGQDVLTPEDPARPPGAKILQQGAQADI